MRSTCAPLFHVGGHVSIETQFLTKSLFANISGSYPKPCTHKFGSLAGFFRPPYNNLSTVPDYRTFTLLLRSAGETRDWCPKCCFARRKQLEELRRDLRLSEQEHAALPSGFQRIAFKVSTGYEWSGKVRGWKGSESRDPMAVRWIQRPKAETEKSLWENVSATWSLRVESHSSKNLPPTWTERRSHLYAEQLILLRVGNFKQSSVPN